jgi:drug/metabolite transporter (DMT)-like permease
MFDTTAEKADGTKASIFGDLLALLGALFSATLMMSNKKIVHEIPSVLCATIIMIFSIIF